MKTFQLLRSNPLLFSQYFVKEYTIKSVRKFFETQNYHEIESPILTDALPQERYLDVLSTKINFANGETKTAYLLPSTETFNKKMLVAGIGNHFVITKVFRGLEEISPNHSPEFTMLEWYQVGENYFDLMDTTENLFRTILKNLNNKLPKKFPHKTTFEYQGQKINFGLKSQRFSVRELLNQHCKIELESIQDVSKFYRLLKNRSYKVSKEDDWQTLFEILFSSEIETKFATDRLTFVYDYPRILCPLTKVKESDPLVSEKVEVYLAGKELGNGYTELTDWREQKKRFDEEQKARAKMGKETIAYDYDFIEALKLGMPEVAGIGIGLDRLIMILANVKNISEINFFPPSEWA